MKQSELRLIKRCAEFISQDDINNIPPGLRGIYVLYRYRRKTKNYDVVYVGMSSSGNRSHIRWRLKRHRRNKKSLWTHCSIFEVWDNIRDEEIRELEGLFRQIYKLDSRANSLNVQQGFKKLWRVRLNNLGKWK